MLMATSVASADTTTVTPAPVATSPVSASVEFDVTKNASNKYVGKTTLKIDLESNGPAFGGFDLKVTDGTITLGDWNVGTTVAGATVSLGKQGDLFPSAGLEAVGSTTLANPTVNESLIIKAGGLSAMAGFEGLDTDITDLDNVQVAYDISIGAIASTAAVDYNTDTKAKSYALSSKLNLTESFGVGGTYTYATKSAYEVNATAGAISVFMNGDKDNTVQHIGAGVKGNLGGLDLYAEASYDVDAKKTSPAVGMTFKF